MTMLKVIHLITLAYSLVVAEKVLELPDPRIVIVGPTGAGKSSLANALLGCDPREPNCMFPVCGGLESCTKETTIGTGLWLGTGKNYTVVDTPGFGDSNGEDNELIEEMMEVLDGSLGYANTILLLFDGQTARFSTGLHNMLRQMSALFGDAWWNFMIVGVSKWSYTQEAIDKRQADCDYYGDPSENCKNEAWFMREINSQLHEKFHLNKTFTFAFIDSFSQAGPALNDQVQQDHYQEEAWILWDSATTRNSTFDFMTIDDVLEENALCKQEVERLNDIIDTNITQLFSLVNANEDKMDGNMERIYENEERIYANTEMIDSNKLDIEKKLATAKRDFETSMSHIDDNIGAISGRVTLNEVHIDDANALIDETSKSLESLAIIVETNKLGIQRNVASVAYLNKTLGNIRTDFEDLKLAPLGTIMAWVNKPTLDGEATDLPSGWQRCDGSSIPHPSIWSGKLTPDLNGEKRFLRGGPDKDMLAKEEDQLHDHLHNFKDPGHTHDYEDKYTVNDGTNNAGPGDGDGRFAVSHSKSSSSRNTGITVGSVTPAYRSGTETRPRNMSVIYIIRIF